MNIEQKHGTTIWREAPEEYRPPRSWRSWLIGRPLATADAPDQTIGKLIGLVLLFKPGIVVTDVSYHVE